MHYIFNSPSLIFFQKKKKKKKKGKERKERGGEISVLSFQIFLLVEEFLLG
jgi:hypothetical protein